MKKIVSVVLVFVLLALGAAFFQRERALSSLRALRQGKTYSSYGIKLIISPAEGELGGWIRPYLQIPRVTLDFSALGLKEPLSLEGAKASRSLWGKGGIVIEIPRVLQPRAGFSIDSPFFEVTEDTLQVLSARSFGLNEVGGQESQLLVQGPEILIDKGLGLFPSLLQWGVDGLEWKSAKKKSEFLNLGPMALGVKSQRKSGQALTEFNFYGFGEGGQGNDGKYSIEISPWKFESSGSFQSIPEEEWKSRVLELEQAGRQIYALVQQDISPREEVFWPHIVQQNVSDLSPQVVKNFSDKLIALLARLNILSQSQTFSWEGLKVGGDRVVVSPLQMNSSLQEKGKDSLAQVRIDLGQIRINKQAEKADPAISLDLQGLSIDNRAVYSNMSNQQVVSTWLRHYENMLTSMMLRPIDTNNTDILWQRFSSALAVYPDQLDYDFKIKNLNYVGETSEGKHQELFLTFFVHPQEMGFTFGDHFDLKFKQDAQFDVSGGEFQFRWSWIFPWNDYVVLSRNQLQAPEQKQDWLKPLTGFQGGMDFHLMLNLGANAFLAQIDCKLRTPLERAKVAGAMPLGLGNSPDWEHWIGRFRDVMLQGWFEEGLLEIDFKVQRLSKLQAWLENIQQGSSLGLAALAPYARVDSKADTLELKVQFEKGKILVNGEPNPSLEKLLAPFFQEMGAPMASESQPSP